MKQETDMATIDDKMLVEDLKHDLHVVALLELHHVKAAVAGIRKYKKQIDEDTGHALAQELHKVIAQAHEGLAVLEEVKRVRIAQKTSKVGGGKRKA